MNKCKMFAERVEPWDGYVYELGSVICPECGKTSESESWQWTAETARCPLCRKKVPRHNLGYERVKAVLCVNCEHYSEIAGPDKDDTCLAFVVHRSFVTGHPTYGSCKKANPKGMCKRYKERQSDD